MTAKTVTRQNWFKVRGDETLALAWPLDKNSQVWEIGGFEGRWAAQIYDKFQCHITIFEPQLWAVERMQKRFHEIENIEIRPYGLWITEGRMALGDYWTDGASLLKSNKDGVLCEFRSVSSEVRNFAPGIDLALMNIEGAEFELIPFLVSMGLMDRFERFWCQFHPGLVGNGNSRYQYICDRLEKTHSMLWDCYPTAVAWQRKS